MENIVALQNVSKEFKGIKAVDNISFSIKKGEAVAILGPNGAGKTTSILMMLGLLEPTSGTVKLFNQSPKEKKVRERIGAMLQEVSVIDALKVKEIIHLFRSYYPRPMDYDELAYFTGLHEEDMKKKADKLSGGQKRRLGFALALAGNPDLLFFDEPTVGMDITSRKIFWDTIHKLKERGKTIIFTTHYLQEADDVADRMVLFHKGRIVTDGSPQEIKAKLTKKTISFATNDMIKLDELRQLAYVTNVYQKDDRIYLVTEDTDRLLETLFDNKNKIKIKGVQVEQGSLDEAFTQLTEEPKEAM